VRPDDEKISDFCAQRKPNGGRSALAAADIGIAMGTGTDVAIESAGVTLLKGDLQGIVRGRRLSSATMHNIRENLFFAFIYNAAGVPIAAGVLYPFFGVLLSPIIAAAAMTLSSVSVILNSLRLRKVKVDEPTIANRFYSIVRNRQGTAWAATAALLAISIGSILIGYAPKFLTPRETGPSQVEKAAPLPTLQAAPAPPAAAIALDPQRSESSKFLHCSLAAAKVDRSMVFHRLAVGFRR
jgi:uncharacterized membrane protein (DUF485 family)